MEENNPNVLDINQMGIQTEPNSIQMSDNSREAAKKHGTLTMWGAAIFATLGSALLNGYYFTLVSSSAKYIHQFYNTTWIERYGEPIGNDTTTLLWSITVSIISIGGGVGSLIYYVLVQRLGRKGTLLVNNCFTLPAALLMSVAERAGSFEMLIIGRFINGISAGIARNALNTYLAEISPKHIRGSVCTLYSIFGSAGILFGQMLGLPELLGQESRWNFLYAFIALPAILQLSVLPIFPESPRYLLIDKNDEAGAEKALRRFTGKEDVSEELEEIKAERQSQRDIKTISVFEILRNPTVRWQMIVTCVLAICHQLNGINAVHFYSNRLLKPMGIEIKLIPYVTLSIGAIGLITTMIVGTVIERSGRKLLLFLGYGGIAVSYILLTVLFSVQDKAPWIPYLIFTCVLAVILCDSIGPSAVSSSVVSELFQQNFRPSALLIYGLCYWMCQFILGLVFPYLQIALQDYVFLVFMVICAACTIFLIIVLPETKAKTFREISQSFAKLNKIDENQNIPLEDTSNSNVL